MPGYLSTSSVHMLDHLAAEDAAKRQIKVLAFQLTPREKQVAALVAQGLPNTKIAMRLDISVHTVKFHIDNLLSKLNVDRRTGIAAFAVRAGLC